MGTIITKKAKEHAYEKSPNFLRPFLDETIPHQAGFPSFKGTGIKMEPPFCKQARGDYRGQ
ncbi:hypothetical protein GCM10020331_072640 [Ectobacillus funiculus]